MTSLNKLSYFLFVSLSAIWTMSCKKFVDVKPGTNLVQTVDVFSSEKQALSAVSGVYSSLRGGNFLLLNGGLSLYAGLAADDLYATSPTTTTDPFYQNELLANNSTSNSFFYSHPYKVIYQVNAILEGIAVSSSLVNSAKDQFIGEMKVVRALMYFYLVNLFGDVPLITTSDYKANATKPRSPVNEVYLQIIQDLKDAQNLLATAYPSTGKARPNKWTTAALLARIYLYKGDWVNTEIQASLVINSATYSLLSSANIGNVFLKEGLETIWEISNTSDVSVPGDPAIFIPSSAGVKPSYAFTTSLLNSFEVGDLRRTTWMAKNTVSGIDYWYPRKYKQKSIASGSSPTEYQILLRLSEQYLIRAEARAQKGDLAGAQSDLNIIRGRAGLPATTAITQADLLAAIEKENQFEYFAEQGHRWLDLKRNSRADAVLGALKGATWQATDKLWPIPELELTYNPFLVQNPGY